MYHLLSLIMTYKFPIEGGEIDFILVWRTTVNVYNNLDGMTHVHLYIWHKHGKCYWLITHWPVCFKFLMLVRIMEMIFYGNYRSIECKIWHYIGNVGKTACFQWLPLFESICNQHVNVSAYGTFCLPWEYLWKNALSCCVGLFIPPWYL